MCRASLVAPKLIHKAGFHPTAVLGAMGAAAAAAIALRFSKHQFVNALGIAGSMAAGIIEYLAEGAWTKRMHPGWAAQSGIRAADLARAGFVGPRAVFEGTHGLFHGFARTADGDWDKLVGGFGERWVANSLAFKPYACGTMTQPYVDCARRLAQKGVRAEEVVEMVCEAAEGTVHRLWEPLADKQRPPNAYFAKFSQPYCIAAGFVLGHAGLEAFTEERVRDERLRSLAAKVRYEIDPDEACELLGRHRHRIDRLPRKALPQRRRGERLVDLGVQPLGDLLRQLRRPDDAVPLHAVEALEPRFLEGGHAGNQRVALEAGDGERLYLACADVRQRRRESRHQHLDLSAQHIGKRRTDAAVVRVHGIEARGGSELLQGEVVEQADPTRRVVQLAGVVPRIVDEAPQIGGRHRGMHDQDVAGAADHGDGGEVLDGVVRQLAHGGVGAVRADVAHHQRVAVRGSARDRLRGDGAAAARGIFDDDGLVHRAAELVRDRAADQIQAAARLRGNDDLHRLERIGLRAAGRRHQCDQYAGPA